MKPSELVTLLQECYRDRLALTERHKAVAAHVSPYDANNTYQYVINREETHLSWLADAIADLGGTLPDEPPGPRLTIERTKDAWKRLVADDARAGQTFIERWGPPVDAGVTNARHRTMLRLMLGEVQEQTRLFEQAVAGEPNLLGRNTDGAGQRGVVRSTRWIGD